MEYFAGLDVSLRSCAICVVDAKGKVLLEKELPCEVGDIADYLNGFGHPIERIGFEAGTLSQHLFYGLTREGFDVVCMEARQVNAALSAMRNKTDKNDARGIAHVLRTGWFSPVHMKSREAHGVRALLSALHTHPWSETAPVQDLFLRGPVVVETAPRDSPRRGWPNGARYPLHRHQSRGRPRQASLREALFRSRSGRKPHQGMEDPSRIRANIILEGGNANQMRLMLHSCASLLWWKLRAACPRRSPWRHAQFDTLRLHLVKLAATVVDKKTRIIITLPTSCPRQGLLHLLFDALAPPKAA